MDPPVPLQPRDQAHESQPHDDGQRAQDDGDGALVLEEQMPHGAEEGAHRDEHGGKPQDEQD
jgi:hypothetical protein